mmetsp:Transcript_55650/g.121196  ORF Transcript_55650/g.121196 Transcript_55650/m.121196 type:complete len:82 (-) Transcript_55650:114-359(-)
MRKVVLKRTFRQSLTEIAPEDLQLPQLQELRQFVEKNPHSFHPDRLRLLGIPAVALAEWVCAVLAFGEQIQERNILVKPAR